MILTLGWKELREHQGIWLTMAFMTVALGLGLAFVVSLEDPQLAVPVATLTILALTTTYGVVCGAMMFAGEHEGGTLVFLDIFLGRRGLLWVGKFAIGLFLVTTQALAVSLALWLLEQEPPRWLLVGRQGINPDPSVWFIFLPVVGLEAFAWGLLGSALTQRVLAGAAVAAIGVTPLWLIAIITPAQVFFTLQLFIAVIVLAVSYMMFLNQSRETAQSSPVEMPNADVSREAFLEIWDEIREEEATVWQAPAQTTAVIAAPSKPSQVAHPVEAELPPLLLDSSRKKADQAKSPREVLWWLVFEQAKPVLWIVAAVCLLVGMLSASSPQAIWPLATLLLGVACGTAAFAPEQRDQSYQFLSAQRFPLPMVWRFKILFWLAVAIAGSFVILFAHSLVMIFRRPPAMNQGFAGTFPGLMGPALFFPVWLAYGFAFGQLFVLLCRKSILALLVSSLVAAGGIGLWLPSLLCGGMNGWQLWVAPLTMLLATWFLVRAWASGRIFEHKPLAALLGFGFVTIVWALLNFGYRAVQVPDVGEPLDPKAFRATFPPGDDITATNAIQAAVAKFPGDDTWPASMAEATRLPVGMLETPRSNSQAPLLLHLPACGMIAADLRTKAKETELAPAFEYVAQILALSRNMRNKAPVKGYLAGVEIEKSALDGLDEWLTRGKPTSQLLRRVLSELDRHANETPHPMDCLQTECYRAAGLLDNPNAWNLPLPGDAGQIPERWLTGGIAVSLEMPWEAERKQRIWRLAWAGLFRAIETPHWQRTESVEADQPTPKRATLTILQGWLPIAEGPTRTQMVRLLDDSWLADERLFCPVSPLREAATRARWRVDAMRQALALSLYRLDHGKPAPDLQALVPQYLAHGLPTDPYSGNAYRYRITADAISQGIVWSTGPDRIDHGGREHGDHLSDTDARWSNGEFDLITLEPRWR